ncbi:hypothetical protein KFU94_06360 [Chloroflexi bacterium TSY]|nr:hypothetical protein [Chloroflexi bacterium TSY]
MGKFSNFLIGTVVGIAITAIVNYLFGPANETTYDANYRSRIDKALEEGQLAAHEHQLELIERLEEAKRTGTQKKEKG